MEKVIWLSDEVPKDAKVLLVDMQESFIQSFDVSIEVHQRIRQRLLDMKQALIDLKKEGHKIYAVVDVEYGNTVHPVLSDLIDEYLPTCWTYQLKDAANTHQEYQIDQYELNPMIITQFNEKDEVIVCGLWRELCLSTITQLLQKEGIRAILSINPSLSFENALMWGNDKISELEEKCAIYGSTVQNLMAIPHIQKIYGM